MFLSPRRLFLFDAIGALLSALCLGVILPRFQELFGVPLGVVYILAFLAVIFCVFSCLNFLIPHKRQKEFLKATALMNVGYCGITAGVMLVLQQSVTVVGNVYFVLEILLILVLALLEWRAALDV